MTKARRSNNDRYRKTGSSTDVNQREKLGLLKNQSSETSGSERRSRNFPNLSGFASMSFSHYFPQMKDDPLAMIDRCQTAFVSLETNFLRQRYELMALIYGFALGIRDDRKKLDQFLSKPFWHGCTYKRHKGILRMAFQYCLMTSIDDPLYHRACTYARALSGFFEENVPMEEIPELIEGGGGIEKLAQMFRKLRSANAVDDPQAIDDGDEDGSDLKETAERDVETRTEVDNDFSDDAVHDGDSDAAPPVSEASSRLLRPPKLDLRRDLVVTMQPDMMRRAMQCVEGQEIRIKATASGNTGSWREFKVLDLRLKDPPDADE